MFLRVSSFSLRLFTLLSSLILLLSKLQHPPYFLSYTTTIKKLPLQISFRNSRINWPHKKIDFVDDFITPKVRALAVCEYYLNSIRLRSIFFPEGLRPSGVRFAHCHPTGETTLFPPYLLMRIGIIEIPLCYDMNIQWTVSKIGIRVLSDFPPD